MADKPTADRVSPSGSSEHAQKGTNGDAKASTTQGETGEEKPSKLKQLWAKAGLDFGTIITMVKGSLAPTIAIAMYQSPRVAGHYGTLGYLIAIMSVLGLPIMPRGVFIRTMSLNVLAVCLGAAVNLLALYTAIQARINTAAPRAPPNAYNSSGSAVCAVWLFLQVYLINYLRIARPAFQFPVIIFSIFAIVSMSYGPTFPNMTYVQSFMKRLMEAFLTGFGLATGVHFLFFPVSSRTVVFKEMTGYLTCLGGMLNSQTAYMQSLESIDPVALHEKSIAEETSHAKGNKVKSALGPLDTPASAAMKEVFMKLLELHSKLDGDIRSAKREFAIGKLESKDISEMWKELRKVFVPIFGLSSSIDVLKRRANERHWDSADLSPPEAEANRQQIESLHATMKALHEPFTTMTEAISSGFQHIQITLELIKAPKQKPDDEESNASKAAPGSAAFAENLRRKIDDFRGSRHVTLEHWCQEKGLPLRANIFDPATEGAAGHEKVPDALQRQLFFVLYMEYLLLRAGQATLDFVLFSDKVKLDGKLKSSKLIFPGSRTLYKWLKATIGREDVSKGDQYLTDMEGGASDAVYLGIEFDKRKDPEHLPPRNAFEKMGNHLRSIPRFFRHPASAFGFRVACATMSIAIINFLHPTQVFFQRQRLLWSMIMIVISMTRLSGQSTYNFILRVAGTAAAMVGAYIIWYIVNGHVVGVIVFLWLWMTCAYYIVLKLPKYVIVGILSIVTSVLIIGYELQVRVIGVAASTSNGQPAYPTYLLAPYRLAAVAGGLFVAWIWTIWPYPISENSELRKDIGASMYMLANFSTVVHEIVQSRVRGTEGDIATKGTHAYHLEKSRVAVFGKLLMLLTEMRANSAFSRFNISVGGRFPREVYEETIECIQRIVTSLALVAYASQTLSLGNTPEREKSAWSNDFRRLVTSIHATSNRNTSILSLLSSSLINGQPLPPFLELPKAFAFVQRLESIDRNILSVRHIEEPEYSAFAVIQSCGGSITADIEKLVMNVKSLVGEIDFPFRPANASNSSSERSSAEMGKGKAE